MSSNDGQCSGFDNCHQGLINKVEDYFEGIRMIVGHLAVICSVESTSHAAECADNTSMQSLLITSSQSMPSLPDTVVSTAQSVFRESPA